MDTVDRQTRSKIMSRIRGKNTSPELQVRKALHRRGFRYRLHAKDLPGSPDLVFPKYRAVIFVHGCFWHRHGCHMTTMPKTQVAFWTEKFNNNIARDRKALDKLLESGWRVLTIWECALKGKTKLDWAIVEENIVKWLYSDCRYLSISPERNNGSIS